MVQTSFDGQTIAKVLRQYNYRAVGRTGSHLKFRWEHSTTDEVRVVTAPIKSADEIPRGTMRSIASRGAKDFREWCR